MLVGVSSPVHRTECTARQCNEVELFYVPVTVHREQSVKEEYQQDATI